MGGDAQGVLFESAGTPPPTFDGPLGTCQRCKRAMPRAELNSCGRALRCKRCEVDANLWRFYRLSRTDFESMLAAQLGRCFICLEPFGEAGPRIDHNHDCDHPDRAKIKGRPHATCCRACVRALLCSRCNTLVGYLEKCGHLLDAAERYLLGESFALQAASS